LKNAEFVSSVDKYQPHSVARKRFLDRASGRKYKFRFTPKFPSICIYQKYLMGVGSLHIFYSLNLNGGLEAVSSVFGYFGYQNLPLPKLSIFRHVSAEILP